MAAGPSDHRELGLVAVLASIVGFSFGSTLAKSAHLPVPVLMFWRSAIAAMVWQLWCARPGSQSRVPSIRRADPSTRRAILLTMAAGAVFGLNTLLVFNGVVRTRVANAEFIVQLSPLLVVPIAARRLRERIERVVIAYGVLALCGVAIIIFTGETRGTHRWAGDLFVVAGVFVGVAYGFVIREARQHLDTAPTMALITSTAATVVLPFAIADGGLLNVDLRGVLCTVALALLASVFGHGLQAWAQRHVPLSSIALLGLAQPALATTWALVFLGEGVRATQVAGMAVALLAVAGMAAQSPGGRARRQAREQEAVTVTASAN